MQVLPFDGRFAAVGPLFLPEETCCFECYLLRRASNVEYGDELAVLAREPAPWPMPPPLAATVAGLAALQALRWLALRDPFVPGVLTAVELDGVAKLGSHVVYRVPRCPACSGLDELAPPLPWFEELAA
jgi:bacteriocin biosynthesis cyclodehydratase domain-containing protein